jgi:hypothetical protein
MGKSTPDFESHLARKEEARKFLEALEGFLKTRMAPSIEVRVAIEDAVKRAKASTTDRRV